ncbi:MAG: nucleoside-diphosphate sugar epimerase/dehydratase [Bacteroidota bacterium]
MINTLKNKVIQFFRNHSLPKWFVLTIDLAAVFLTFLLSYLLRFNLDTDTFSWVLAIKQGLIVCLVYLVFMLIFRSYSGLIRQTTIKDTFIIAITNASAFLVLFFITLFSRKFELGLLLNIPWSIATIHYGIVTVSLVFFRVFIKMFYVFVSVPSSNRKNVLIYGSGDMGILVKRVIEGDPKGQLRLSGFIDDDKKIQGKKVDGIPVFSKNVLTKDFIDAEEIKVFIFAIKDISARGIKDVLKTVINLGLEILETPTFDQWLNGNLHIQQLRKVQFEDLLGRDPIKLEIMRIEEGLRNKTILVTGAAGSIGSEIVRQLTKFNYKRLVLVDQAETPSFYLDNELKSKFSNCCYDLIIGDVTNEKRMDSIFRRFRPEIVFHAAAYKHVPLMEANPHEAFRVNVGGTKIISELSIKYHVEKFVMISSDKAVNPTNVMGATKRICELLVHAQSGRYSANTKFITTRFGNVLGSNGSVIPIFKKQISEGGPVTITHPEITRFFMTIPEACQLVLEAGFMGNGGHIYVFDMGEPVKILDVAKNLILLSGLQPYKDIKIKFVGLRPGEKLFEELFNYDEPRLSTHHPKISIAEIADNDCESLLVKIDTILASLYKMTDEKLIEEMHEIVPGYTSKYATTLQGNG